MNAGSSLVTMRLLPTLFASACLMVAGCDQPPPPAAAVDRVPAFWAWHRSSRLTEKERATLPAGCRIYRQIAEFGWRDGNWSPRVVAEAAALSELELPVVRIDPGPAFLEQPDAAIMLAKWLRHHFHDKPPGRQAPWRLSRPDAATWQVLRDGQLACSEVI